MITTDSIIVFCLGACIGSFLNVCIYRIPKGESIIYPHSHCSCGKTIPFYNNIPILSWLILRGKAACCGSKISVRYLFIEALTAILFTLCFAKSTSLINFIISAIFISLLLMVSFIDIDTMEINDWLSIGGMFLGMCCAAFFPNWRNDPEWGLLNSLIGACFGSGLLLWIGMISEMILKKETIGFGDIKLIGTIGAFLGCKACIFAIFGGCVILSVILLPKILILKFFKKTKLPKEVPFAPFLATGSIAYILWGDPLIQFLLL